jgi:3-hydroxybutyryl-CoA dehydrogenase
MTPVPFSTVAVIGLGTVGSALARRLRDAGLSVIAIEAGDAALERGRRRVAQGAADGVPDVRYSTDLAYAAPAGLVIEAVPERLDDKRAVLRRAHEICGPDTILATTTTALSVAALGSAGGRPDRTVALHLPRPTVAGAVAELAGTPTTNPAVLARMTDLARLIRSVPLAVADRPGFLAGGLLMGFLNSAVTMLGQRYATRDDIDDAMRLGCGLPRGPLAHLDDIGLDVARDTLAALHARSGRRCYAPAPLLAELVGAGRLGRKTGHGFHRYDAADPAPERPAPPAAPRPVTRIGVVGSGEMAVGIAQVCVTAGYPTVLAARSPAKAEAAAATVRELLRRDRRGTRPQGAEHLLTCGSGLDVVGDCDLVIEAVAEDLTVKRQVFAVLDRIARPGTVLASTTSSLPVAALAEVVGRPQDVLALHFLNPPGSVPLVEMASGPLTGAGAAATAHAVCLRLGKQVVWCADRAGFVVNALLFPYLNSAAAMLGDGVAGAEDLDLAMRRGCGFPMGPLALLDLVGLDVAQAILRNLRSAVHHPALAPATELDRLVAAGHLGRKTGRGFHTYLR